MAIKGNPFRERREKMGYDLEYIYQKTRIHPKVIKALESDDFSYFSSDVYLNSFIKKYAGFLGLDSGKVRDRAAKINKNKNSTPKQRQILDPELLSPFQKFGLIVKVGLFFIVVIALIYITFYGINRIFTVVFKDHHSSISDNNAGEILKREDAPKIKKKTTAVNIVFKTPLTLGVYVKSKCWVQLRADNVKIYEGILEQGQRESWKAEKEFELWVGDASRLQLTLNGRSLVILGKGIIKGIRIDKNGLKLP